MTYHFNVPVECYGHGRWIREWVGWPQWIPFPAYSDHGVSLDSYHAPHEVDNEFLIHFFWSDYKQQYSFQIDAYNKRRFIQIAHPYLTLKNRKFRFCSADRSGLLVFWPHTTPGYTYSADYIDEYLDYLLSIKNRFSQINICIACIDLEAPWISKIKARFNTVTAGYPLDPLYPERLLSLIDAHEYATCPRGGSQVAYCTMMGVKYFIDGPVPIYQNIGDPNIPEGNGLNRSMRYNSLTEQLRNIFSKDNIESWQSKVAFIEPLLGVSANPNRLILRIYLAAELIRLLAFTKHGSLALKYYLRSASRLIRKGLKHIRRGSAFGIFVGICKLFVAI
jgi:hypothetical protein